MHPIVKLFALTVGATTVLGGCTELTAYFGEGDPAEVSTCVAAYDEFEIAPGNGLMCVECNSETASTAKDSYCGAELKARCNSDLGYPVFGIALGGFEGGGFMTGSAWVDVDDDGADGDDAIICHEQSGELLSLYLEGGKQEWKCTSALKGNGKDATTFEVELKYDPSKNECL